MRLSDCAGLLLVLSQLMVGCGRSAPEPEPQPAPESPAAAVDPASEVPEGEQFPSASQVRWLIAPQVAGLPEDVMIAFIDGNPLLKDPFTFQLRFPPDSGLMPTLTPPPPG